MSIFGKSTGGGRRSAAREAAPLTAVFTTVTRSHSATLVDISATGARLEGRNLPLEGELVELSMARVRTFGLVKWVLGEQCGIAFDVKLDCEDVGLLREHVESVKGLPPEIKAAYDNWMIGAGR